MCCGPTHTAVVTERGALYTCGLNNSGQLGHGGPAEEDRARYAVDDILAEENKGAGALVEADKEEQEAGPPGPSRTGATVAGSSRGGTRSGTRRTATGAGTRPGTGAGDDGAESEPAADQDTATLAAQRPHTVLSPRALQSLARLNVLQVACGSVHMLALTDHGVFSWGAGDGGRLGARVIPSALFRRGAFAHSPLSLNCGGVAQATGPTAPTALPSAWRAWPRRPCCKSRAGPGTAPPSSSPRPPSAPA